MSLVSRSSRRTRPRRRGGRRPGSAASGHGNEFRQVNLISDLGNQGAQIVDPNLVNPWGLALGPATPLWVADNNAGVATVYRTWSARPGPGWRNPPPSRFVSLGCSAR